MEPRELDPTVNKALSLARAWQDRANELLTSEEKGIQEQMKQLMTHPIDKAVLTKMIDQSFRPRDNSRVADQVNAILSSYGIPDFFPRVDRLLIQMFLGFGRHFPAFTVPKMINKMRGSSSRAIIPGEKDALQAHLQKRKKQGVRMNINHLGEALLGEKEARRRLDTYIEDMKNPEIEYISVKISTIYSQILPIAFDHTVSTLKERLSELYRVAGENIFVRSDGTKVPKFVNLDMEESCSRRIFPIRIPSRKSLPNGPKNGWRPGGVRSNCASSRAPTWRWSRWSRPYSTGPWHPTTTSWR